MSKFLSVQPTAQNHFRAVILFGRNVASYKFALGKSLLELADTSDDLVRLEELAIPFGKHIREHISLSPKQATSSSSRFLEVCRQANAGEITEDAFRALTVALGFNNVIDAFHRLGSDDIAERFFIDERNRSKGIRLTDALRRLREDEAHEDLAAETEARWRLVETAWDLGVAHSMISHHPGTGTLVVDRNQCRVAVTSARAALNGYQKGRWFYCFFELGAAANKLNADVDHVFPWSLRQHISGNINGVWNLVLACPQCNRGRKGKSDFVPSIELVERLHRRNEFLITSHHPLRETLMAPTGAALSKRIDFLNANYSSARLARIIEWMAVPKADIAF